MNLFEWVNPLSLQYIVGNKNLLFKNKQKKGLDSHLNA